MENNEIVKPNQTYSTFSLAAALLTGFKCIMIIINIVADTNLRVNIPLVGGSLVLAIISRKKFKDKLSLVMIIIDIILIVIEIIIYIIMILLIVFLAVKL